LSLKLENWSACKNIWKTKPSFSSLLACSLFLFELFAKPSSSSFERTHLSRFGPYHPTPYHYRASLFSLSLIFTSLTFASLPIGSKGNLFYSSLTPITMFGRDLYYYCLLLHLLFAHSPCLRIWRKFWFFEFRVSCILYLYYHKWFMGRNWWVWYDFAYGTWCDGWLNIGMRFGMHDNSMFGQWDMTMVWIRT